jgi:nucleoid-associated protein YgaU
LNFGLTGHYTENTFLLSYGENVREPVYLGLNLKVLQKIVGQDMYTEIDPVFDYGRRTSKTGYSVDFGSLFSITSRLSLALSITDINQPDMIFYKTSEVQSSKVPYGFKTGVAYQEDTLNIAVDFACKESIIQNETDIKVHTGAEKWFSRHTFALRGGLVLGNREYKNMAMGASYKTGVFRFDYAFIYQLSGIEETNGSHRASLTLLFGPSKEELEKKAVREELEKRLEETEQSLKNTQKQVEQTKLKLGKAEIELEKTKKETEQAHNKINKLETERLAGKELEKAKKAYELAVKKEKQKKYNYWFVMGERYVEYGKWEEALKAYRKTLEYKPGDSKAINEIEYIQKEIAKRGLKGQPGKERPKYYVFTEGDTLPSIAEKIYGDSSRWKEIYEANKDKIVEGKPKQGQILSIPW